MFNFFKKKPIMFGILHGMDLRDWNDGYKEDTKKLSKFVNQKLKSMSKEEFLQFLGERDNYRKFVNDEDINDEVGKVLITEPKNRGKSFALPKVGHVFVVKKHINHKKFWVSGFQIANNNMILEDNKIKTGKFKTLIWVEIHNDQDYWSKKISWENNMRRIGFKFIDLDKNEYELLKPFENKLKKDGPSYIDVFINLNKVMSVLLNTKKRKKLPVNRFQTILAFEE